MVVELASRRMINIPTLNSHRFYTQISVGMEFDDFRPEGFPGINTAPPDSQASACQCQ